MVMERKSNNQHDTGFEVTNLRPMLYRKMQLLMFFHHYWYVFDWFQNIGSSGPSIILKLIVNYTIQEDSIQLEDWLHREKPLEKIDGRI
jgi:uncharacterized membrane protein